MRSTNRRRRSRGVIPYALLASVLAIGSAGFTLLDWQEGQKQRREAQQTEEQRENRLKQIEADLATLKKQAANPTLPGQEQRPILLDDLRHVSRSQADDRKTVVEPPSQRGD